MLIVLMIALICDCIYNNRSMARFLHMDIWDWFAILISATSLLFAMLTWRSQDKTMKNTTKLDASDYRTMLVSYYYNIVRSTVYLYSLSECLKSRHFTYYPSEEYLQKLKFKPFEASLSKSQNIIEDDYGKYQRTAEIFHYFNLHIDSAQKHLSSAAIGVDVKKRDMETVIDMIWVVAEEILGLINLICKKNEEENKKLVCKKMIEVSYNLCQNHSVSSNKQLVYIGKGNIVFLEELFRTRQNEYDKFLNNINSTIENQLKKVDAGGRNIPLIPIS